jgi:protein TonB
MILFTSFKQQLISSSSFRWGSSFAFIVCVYVSAVLSAVYWSVSSPPSPTPPMAAMMIDLAPMPVAPETPPNASPPGPTQEETPAPPELMPEPIVEPLPELPELPVASEAEALLPTLLPEPEPIEEEVEPLDEQIAQEDKATPAFEAPVDEIAAAPMEGAVSLAPSPALATWQSVLLGHLQHHKNYPREARRNRQEAVVYVRISINRDGTVVDYSLTQPSAYKALNQEALALIARAQPLPPPPPEMIRDTLEFVVPVEFFLRR